MFKTTLSVVGRQTKKSSQYGARLAVVKGHKVHSAFELGIDDVIGATINLGAVGDELEESIGVESVEDGSALKAVV